MATMGGSLASQGTAHIVWTHVSYLALRALLIFWVARTLSNNGRTFLLDAFLGNEGVAVALLGVTSMRKRALLFNQVPSLPINDP